MLSNYKLLAILRRINDEINFELIRDKIIKIILDIKKKKKTK